jgi:hypothetical protein
MLPYIYSLNNHTRSLDLLFSQLHWLSYPIDRYYASLLIRKPQFIAVCYWCFSKNMVPSSPIVSSNFILVSIILCFNIVYYSIGIFNTFLIDTWKVLCLPVRVHFLPVEDVSAINVNWNTCFQTSPLLMICPPIRCLRHWHLTMIMLKLKNKLLMHLIGMYVCYV